MFGVYAGPAGHLVRFDGGSISTRVAEDCAGRSQRRRHDVVYGGGFGPGGNQAFLFSRLKPRTSATLSVDQIINRSCGPSCRTFPACLTFMQNPPPITVSGQFPQRLPAHAAEPGPEGDLQLGAADRRPKCASLPGFVDVNSDLQIASPQVMVDIDRDRAQALGVTPQQVQDALYSAFGTRQVSTIYAPANQYAVILEVEPQYQRTPDALSKLYVRSSGGRWCRWIPWSRLHRQVGPLTINHFGQLPAVTISFNLRARLLARRQAADAGGRRHPRAAHARQPSATSFQGTVKEFQSSFPEPDDPADRGHPGDLHRAGHSVRELHPPHHDSLRPALGGVRRAADADAVPQGARPVRLRRHHHAVRRGEEERHHDDRFRHRRAAQGRQERRTTPSGRAACCASGPS